MFLLLPTILSFLFLAAHFMHHDGGNMVLTVVAALMPLLLFIRARFILRAFQGLLVLAAAEWLLTLPEVIAIKRQGGGPVMIDVYILSGVAAFNLLAAMLLQNRRLKARYPLLADAVPTA